MSDVNATLPETTVTASRITDDTPTSSPDYSHWMRTWDLTLEKPGSTTATTIDIGSDADSQSQGGTSVSLKDFHLIFEVSQFATQFPWTMVVTAYNVPFDYFPALLEYSLCTLVAGYINPQPHTTPAQSTPNPSASAPSNPSGGSNLFTGNVIWVERGRENATDTFIRIYASTYDPAVNASVINTTLPVGHTQKDVVQACVTAMNAEADKTQQLKVGTLTSNLSAAQSPRARTLYGQPHQILRDVAQSADAYCHISDKGTVNIVNQNDTLNEPTITLNSTTGMIGIPHQNMDASVSVTSLLNVSLRPGGKVTINEKDITHQMATTGTTSGLNPAQSSQVTTTAKMQSFIVMGDGDYGIWSVIHRGDTRGNTWYSEVTTYPIETSKMEPKVT